jgi:hypothetical protein
VTGSEAVPLIGSMSAGVVDVPITADVGVFLSIHSPRYVGVGGGAKWLGEVSPGGARVRPVHAGGPLAQPAGDPLTGVFTLCAASSCAATLGCPPR